MHTRLGIHANMPIFSVAHGSWWVCRSNGEDGEEERSSWVFSYHQVGISWLSPRYFVRNEEFWPRVHMTHRAIEKPLGRVSRCGFLHSPTRLNHMDDWPVSPAFTHCEFLAHSAPPRHERRFLHAPSARPKTHRDGPRGARGSSRMFWSLASDS